MVTDDSGEGEDEVVEEYIDRGESIVDPLKNQIRELESLIEEVFDDERISKEKRNKLANGMVNGCINVLSMELGDSEEQSRRARSALIEILAGEERNPAYG